MLTHQDDERLLKFLIAEVENAPTDGDGLTAIELLESKTGLEYDKSAKKSLLDVAGKKFKVEAESYGDWRPYAPENLRSTLQRLVRGRVEEGKLNMGAFMGVPSEDSPYSQLEKIADADKSLSILSERVQDIFNIFGRLAMGYKESKEPNIYLPQAISEALKRMTEWNDTLPPLDLGYLDTHYIEEGKSLLRAIPQIIVDFSEEAIPLSKSGENPLACLQEYEKRAREGFDKVDELRAKLENDRLKQQLKMYFGAEEVEAIRRVVSGVAGIRYVEQQLIFLDSRAIDRGIKEPKKPKSIGTKETFRFRDEEDLSDNLKDLYSILNDNGFIDCRLDRFKYIFSGQTMTTHGKVRWSGSNVSLYYLIKGLYPFLINEEGKKWPLTLNCFEGDFSEIVDLSNVNVKQLAESKKKILDTCIGIFKKNASRT